MRVNINLLSIYFACQFIFNDVFFTENEVCIKTIKYVPIDNVVNYDVPKPINYFNVFLTVLNHFNIT